MAGITESIQVRPRIWIYKQPKSDRRGSPYWYARVYLMVDGRFIHTKSTKTTDKQHAAIFAVQFFLSIAERVQGFDLPSPSNDQALVTIGSKVRLLSDVMDLWS